MKVSAGHYLVLMIFSGLISLTGCSSEIDDEKAGNAQFCLDDIPITGLSASQRTSQINSCLSKIEGVKTKQANLIRCASGFMIEGFADPNKLVQIGEQLDSTNGQNPTTALMSILVFKSQGTSEITTEAEDKSFAQSTFNSCNETGSSGYLMLSSMANMATVLASVAGGNIANGIDYLIQNPGALAEASAEVIGATALAAYQTSCTNGNNTNTEICNQLGSSITSSNGNITAIGSSLLSTWNASNP